MNSRASLNPRASLLCRSDIKRQRSNSLDFRARGSGSTSKPRSNSDERKSGLFPGRNSNRKSSINFEGAKTHKEFRPLTDKTYQKEKLGDLIEFLKEVSYPHPLSLSKLMQPSKKDFENMFQFLARHFDPTFEVKKLEEDAPRMLKTLCYPFIPNKTTFTYVARTNWPPLLGVLLYLMDLAKFALKSEEETFFHNADFERPEEQAILGEYVFSSYLDGEENKITEEQERELFTKIIKARCPCDIEDVKKKMEILTEELESIQKEVDCYDDLKAESQKKDAELRQFDIFFGEMREHKKKREDVCQKLEEVVAQKESELQRLQETLANKQALYDMQGYDGKKELSYFEGQKKELLEKMDAKKSVFRELQSDCGEMDIQYRLALDKGMATCESFNNEYSSTADTAQTILAPLENLADPMLKALTSNVQLEFPDCSMQPGKRFVVQWSSARHTSLEELKQKCDSAILIFRGVAATQNQKLHEILMKKSELAVNLKMAASEETQKGRDLTSKEKQALDDVKSVESECNAMIKKLEALQAERIQIEEDVNRDKEELGSLENIKKERLKTFNHYLADQQNHFAAWKKSLEEFEQLCLESGGEIFAAVEKAVNKKK